MTDDEVLDLFERLAGADAGDQRYESLLMEWRSARRAEGWACDRTDALAALEMYWERFFVRDCRMWQPSPDRAAEEHVRTRIGRFAAEGDARYCVEGKTLFEHSFSHGCTYSPAVREMWKVWLVRAQGNPELEATFPPYRMIARRLHVQWPPAKPRAAGPRDDAEGARPAPPAGPAQPNPVAVWSEYVLGCEHNPTPGGVDYQIPLYDPQRGRFLWGYLLHNLRNWLNSWARKNLRGLPPPAEPRPFDFRRWNVVVAFARGLDDPKDRAVFERTILGDEDDAVVGGDLGLSANAVTTRRHRLRVALRRLEELGKDSRLSDLRRELLDNAIQGGPILHDSGDGSPVPAALSEFTGLVEFVEEELRPVSFRLRPARWFETFAQGLRPHEAERAQRAFPQREPADALAGALGFADERAWHNHVHHLRVALLKYVEFPMRPATLAPGLTDPEIAVLRAGVDGVPVPRASTTAEVNRVVTWAAAALAPIQFDLPV